MILVVSGLYDVVLEVSAVLVSYLLINMFKFMFGNFLQKLAMKVAEIILGLVIEEIKDKSPERKHDSLTLSDVQNVALRLRYKV